MSWNGVTCQQRGEVEEPTGGVRVSMNGQGGYLRYLGQKRERKGLRLEKTKGELR
jgi:hypothetical protein